MRLMSYCAMPMVAANSAVSPPTQATTCNDSGASRNRGVHARNEVDACCHHCCRVDERRNRRGPFHGIREPYIQRQLRRLAEGRKHEQIWNGLHRPSVIRRRIGPIIQHRH